MRLLNSTQIPNTLLEALYVKNSEFSESEKDMLLYICRRTIGWRKETDWLTFRRIEQDLERKKSHVSEVLSSLEKKGAIVREKKGGKAGWLVSLCEERWIKKFPNTEPKVPPDGTKSSLTRNSHIYTKETTTKETPTLAPENPVRSFSFEEELEKLRVSERKDFKVIALYWKYKEFTFENQKQFNAGLKRELRAAKDLTGYNGKQVLQAIAHCQKNYSEWSLETVHKRISDVVNVKR